MNKHTISDLYQMQSLPLSAKIRMTEYRIREWVEYYGYDGVYISFSGGKDSTVLLDIARKMYPKIGAVYVDTGLEYPEVREFVKQYENVEIIRPKMNFRQIIIKYGYPMIGKEVAGCVYGARRYVEKLMEREKSAKSGGSVANHSYMADLVGIDRRDDRENELYKSLIRGEIPSTDIKAPVRYLILHGKYPHKENGVETSEYSKMYNKERYKFFLEAPFEISNHCCSIMKKAPMHNYAKKTGKMPMTAQMASESRLRTTNWLKNGCNGFNMKSPNQVIPCHSGQSRTYWNISTITISRLQTYMGRWWQTMGKYSRREIQWIWGFLMWENLCLTLPDATGRGVSTVALAVTGKNHRTAGSLQRSSPILKL